MKTKKILLVNDNFSELEIIQDILNKMGLNYTLYSVATGRDALNALMGSSRHNGGLEDITIKTRPDMILLNTKLPDMESVDFLEIVSKYYSLKNINIFLLTEESATTAPLLYSLYERYSISGHIERPLEADPKTAENIKRLVSRHSYLSLASFSGTKENRAGVAKVAQKSVLNSKALLLKLGYSSGLKIAAGVAATLFISVGIASGFTDDRINKAQVKVIRPSSESLKPAPTMFEGKKHHTTMAIPAATRTEVIEDERAPVARGTLPADHRVQSSRVVPVTPKHTEQSPKLVEEKNTVGSTPQSRDFKIKISAETDSISTTNH